MMTRRNGPHTLPALKARSMILMGLAMLGLLALAACELQGGQTPAGSPVVTPAESFGAGDVPTAFSVQTTDLATSQAHAFNFLTPWGYGRAANTGRLYPLVVVGCWNESGGFTEATRKKYPSFYVDFNNYWTDTDGSTLANLVDAALAANYRIDPHRIYLTGFSQGGSGSFKIVRGMLAKNKLFAGIVRVAGQSESILAEGAMAKTAVWYHIGLNDDATRVDVARATYQYAKSHAAYAVASESTLTDTLTGFSRTTRTLTRNGIQMLKLSEYQGMGHDPSACYRDPALFHWLFNQTLSRR